MGFLNKFVDNLRVRQNEDEDEYFLDDDYYDENEYYSNSKPYDTKCFLFINA